MTFFSRIRLNPTRRDTRRLVASPQAMHAVVMGSCPLGASADEGRVLWRLDADVSHDLELFVVSPSQPDFTGLLEQAGWPTLATWDMTPYLPFLDRLRTGQQWRFRLTANPVRSVAVVGERGRVSPHVTVAHQEGWFLSRAQSWGFGVPASTEGSRSVRVGDRHTAGFSRAEPASGGTRRSRVAITTADFRGHLEIEDVDLFRHSLVHGMGRAKAYGCGLMTLAPA